MTGSEQQQDETRQWVVYLYDKEDARPMPYFLDVCDSKPEALQSMEKWWKAFEDGEKEKPKHYGGVSHAPVSDFDEWMDGDDSD